MFESKKKFLNFKNRKGQNLATRNKRLLKSRKIKFGLFCKNVLKKRFKRRVYVQNVQSIYTTPKGYFYKILFSNKKLRIGTREFQFLRKKFKPFLKLTFQKIAGIKTFKNSKSDLKGGKGNYGRVIQQYILKNRYLISHEPATDKYDLPQTLNSVTGVNVSIKSTQSWIIYCADLFRFMSNKNFEMVLIRYKVLIPNKKIKLINVYLLDSKESDRLVNNMNFSSGKLEKLKKYFMSLSPTHVTKCQRSEYKKLARKIDSNSLFTINCKLNRSNHRIQCSFSLKNYLNRKKSFFKNLDKYSNLILNI